MSYIVFRIVSSILNIMQFLIFMRVILSWVMQGRYNAFTAFLYYATEPILAPIRNLLLKIPALSNIPMDFSPIAALLILSMIQSLVI